MILFYILAILLIFLSYKSFRGGVDYLDYFKSELVKPRSEFMPFASIIVPCKGLDDGLRENLSVLLEQEYPDYEVIFVVDDRNDAAAPIIEEVSRKPQRTQSLSLPQKPKSRAKKSKTCVRASCIFLTGPK